MRLINLKWTVLSSCQQKKSKLVVDLTEPGRLNPQETIQEVGEVVVCVWHGVFCLHSSPLVPSFLCCVNERNGFDFLGRPTICRPCFMPTDACSSWRGLLMTCTSLEQHWGCCEWAWVEERTTPRNLTEPLWQWAGLRKKAGIKWADMEIQRETSGVEGYEQVQGHCLRCNQ